MRCSICQNKVRADSRYCHHCGALLDQDSTQGDFENRFAEIKAMMKPEYHRSTKESIWNEIGMHPLDKFYTEIIELYLGANEPQRQRIYQYFDIHPKLLKNIRYYVRRVGALIKSESDEKWLQYGITAAIFDGGRTDPRDLIVSLVLLRYAAERNGINTEPYFDDGIQLATEKMILILKNASNHPEDAISKTVAKFWQSEMGLNR